MCGQLVRWCVGSSGSPVVATRNAIERAVGMLRPNAEQIPGRVAENYRQRLEQEAGRLVEAMATVEATIVARVWSPFPKDSQLSRFRHEERPKRGGERGGSHDSLWLDAT